MELDCHCEEWKRSMPDINGAITLRSLRAGQDLYRGKPFKFCPWCGDLLLSAETRAHYEHSAGEQPK